MYIDLKPPIAYVVLFWMAQICGSHRLPFQPPSQPSFPKAKQGRSVWAQGWDGSNLPWAQAEMHQESELRYAQHAAA